MHEDIRGCTGTAEAHSYAPTPLWPQVMIDHSKRTLRLIDWGLAEFYHPGGCQGGGGFVRWAACGIA